MKRNAKITIAALSAMLIMALAVTVITFSLAGRNDKKLNDMPEGNFVAANDGIGLLTNIDYIIKNSLSDDPDVDPTFHIVEIHSGDTPSALSTMVSSGNFRMNVINGHRTKDTYEGYGQLTDENGNPMVDEAGNPVMGTILLEYAMPADTDTKIYVEYTHYKAANIKNSTDNEFSANAIQKVAQADLIYVSNDESAQYSESSNISEDLFNTIYAAALSSFKPVIIDSPVNFGKPPVKQDDTLYMSGLVEEYFSSEGSFYYTFGWNTASWSREYFLNGAIGTDSMYLGINPRNVSKNWQDVTNTATSTTAKMSRMLIVSANGDKIVKDGEGKNISLADGSIAKKLFADDETATSLPAAIDTIVTADAAPTPVTELVYDIYAQNGAAYNKMYNRRYDPPMYVALSEMSVADLDAAVTSKTITDLSSYDMIIIENDCGGNVISKDLYSLFVSTMYGKTHIVYDTSMGAAGTPDTPNSGDSTDTKTSNYKELFYLFAYEDETPRYSNIMVTNRNKMMMYAEGTVASCKPIADLINNSSYRGIGGSGSSSTMFTVLEIQPCYPVDLTMANANGYYNLPAQMANLPKEQIEGTYIDDNGKLVATKEYYAWELSEAKIANALNMDAANIKLVHMSSEELAANKTEILGNYDLVYIGGNTSAFYSPLESQSFYALARSAGSVTTGQCLKNLDDVVKLPIYRMYAHTGDFNVYDGRYAAQEGDASPYRRLFGYYPGSGAPMAKSIYDSSTGVKADYSFATMNGNDITYNVKESLLEYINAGMPVILSKSVSDAYSYMTTAENMYYQNSIDPQSNMYKVISAAYGKTSTVLNFDPSNTYLTDNDGGRLGSTVCNYVEVFGNTYTDDNGAVHNGADEVSRVFNQQTTTHRPKLALTKQPATYNRFDSTTWLAPGEALKFELDVAGINGFNKSCVKLYIDDNGNSKFEDSEEMSADISSDGTKVTYEIGDFSGPIYWKVEVSKGNQCASQTGIAFASSGDAAPTTIRVLQLMPSEIDPANRDSYTDIYADSYDPSGFRNGEGPEGNSNSLYFCPQCQFATKRLEYNPYCTDGMKQGMYHGKYNDFSQMTKGTVDGNGIYLGRHEHKFGIVEYDSNLKVDGYTGVDDWNSNLANQVSDLFDFELDIMLRSEFEHYSQEVFDYYYNADGTVKDNYEDLATAAANGLAALEEDPNDIVEKKETAETNLRKAFAALIGVDADTLEVKGTGTYAKGTDMYENIFALLQNEHYSDYYFISNNYFVSNRNAEIDKLYNAYALANDDYLLYRAELQKYTRLCNPTSWVAESYDCVILGASDCWGGDDIRNEHALDLLEDYIVKDGTLLLFHDTLGFFGDIGSATLNKRLRAYFGMDRYHLEEDTELKTQLETVGVETQYESGACSILVFSDDDKGISATAPFVSTAANMEINCTTDAYSSSGTSEKGGNVNLKVTGLKANSPVTLLLYVTGANVGPYYWDDTKIKAKYNFTADANGEINVSIKNSYSVKDTVYYVPMKLKAGYEDLGEKYFMSNLSTKPNDDPAKYSTWFNDMASLSQDWIVGSCTRYLSSIAYSDTMFAAAGCDGTGNLLPYKYADFNWGITAKYNYAHYSTEPVGTNHATQNNVGIITLYPFTLGDKLNIAGTHAQAYALDLEDDDMTVWYSLSGGDQYTTSGSNDNQAKKGSSMYAASPNDGMDSYFIYSYKNVSYCGAGHGKVTGPTRDNNYERYLYINIICNSVRPSIAKPKLKIYDPTATDSVTGLTNDTVKYDEDEGIYIYSAGESLEYPDFSFKITADQPNEYTIKSVQMFYDLDYADTEDYLFTEGKDVEIATWGPDGKTYGSENAKVPVEIGTLKYVLNANNNVDKGAFKLNDSYFAPYGGNYTYVVVRVKYTNSKGKTSYINKRIKIKKTDKLFNLT